MLNDSFFQKWLDQPHPSSQNPSVPTPGTDPQGDIELVTQRIEAAGIDITADYGDWLRIGFALADALGEPGRSYYHRLSRFYPDYNQQECDRQYDNCFPVQRSWCHHPHILPTGQRPRHLRLRSITAIKTITSITGSLWKTKSRRLS